MNPPCNRKSRNGNPPPTAGRALVLSQQEEIFPDPMSQSIAEGWRNGVAKAVERQMSAFVPETVAL